MPWYGAQHRERQTERTHDRPQGPVSGKAQVQCLKDHGLGVGGCKIMACFGNYANADICNYCISANKCKELTGFIKHEYVSNRWRVFRKEILERDQHKCRRCGGEINLEVHHRKRVSLNFISFYNKLNCVTLCRECHQQDHDAAEEAYLNYLHYENNRGTCLDCGAPVDPEYSLCYDCCIRRGYFYG